MIVPFREDRINAAIEAAVRAYKKIDISDSLPQEEYSLIQSTTREAIEEAYRQSKAGISLTVEGIQDIVEKQLMDSGNYEIAKSYIVYRNERKSRREDSPRNIKIQRRDGKLVKFKPLKIAAAIEKAIRASRKIEGPSSQEVIEAVNVVTNLVVQSIVDYNKKGIEIDIELIQDEAEKKMMIAGLYQEAKDFIVYRARRATARTEVTYQAEAVSPKSDPGKKFAVALPDGSQSSITEGEIRDRIDFACQDLENVDSEEIFQDTIVNFYEGIKLSEVDHCPIMSARAKVEKDPNYSNVTARLLLDIIYRETFQTDASDPEIDSKHKAYFRKYLQEGIKNKRLDPQLLDFDLDKISEAMMLDRDRQFTYLGIQTVYDRYLIHENEVKVETPQIFWMRVAMGLSLLEGENKTNKAIEFYDVLSQFYFVSSTPTLFNSGTLHSQMSSCYLLTVMDDLSHIFKNIADDAQLSKWAGGLGNDWTNVRATGSKIKGTNGRSQGVVPFLKVANDTAVAVNQGGKRKGAMCAYLETWHLDLEDFLELRKNTGDERRRTHDMNTANWIPDLFMKRVEQKREWTMFSPSDVPDLHDLYGAAFEKRYEEYEAMAKSGEIELFKTVEAVDIWRKMLGMVFETGHPWITFKDPSNIRSPQDHAGVVHSSNLCTEILLNTSKEETAVCNLGSLNLAKHMDENGINEGILAKTVKTVIRMLDNVIDINFYPTKEAETSNKRHRPIGLGLMSFQDCLYKLNISYASPEAVKFADESMEMISYYAILASSELAGERESYPSFEGSKWDRGLLPIDTLDLLKSERGEEYTDVDTSSKMDWNVVRESIKKNGMRNSNTMAIAPTATISNISGVTQSIEPTYKHLFAKSNLSGEFTITNTYLVDALKEKDLWDEEMIDDLKYFDGSILEIDRIPHEIKQVYLTSFEIEPEWIIECASRRQKWIDMGQSLNLYIAEPSGKKLNDMFFQAWKKGLKTTYYLRSLGATQIEKSTTDTNKRGLQPRWMKNKSASSDIKISREETKKEAALPAETCNLDGDCESCQ
ncbi:UNVERIFIED_CONTAM: hypothetical protein GTU68_055068 [Idotea baltica]|nr:hypothetical protein [Idotea baltica]